MNARPGWPWTPAGTPPPRQARSNGSPTNWASTPNRYGPGSNKPRSTVGTGRAPPPATPSASPSWNARTRSCVEPMRSSSPRRLSSRRS
ncbi:putative transposase [Kutzneria albida DSM 43870]|uniref:Putative transposase n=1 Tax=Kutzneria albida DSM 43870 TaxID=1449976 RepID=W5WQ81_9PSEU|nr:putative transposase [Kutzneria albida DSM 43870]